MSEIEMLIGLLERAPIGLETIGERFCKSAIKILADDLLENGVIVPHAKIGEVIYYVDFEVNADKTDFEPKIHRTTVTEILTNNAFTTYYTSCGKTFAQSLFGVEVFLTKEEAEKALKGGAK